jgi:hypothetical protein
LLTGSAAGLRLVYADCQHSGRSLPEFQFQLHDQFASNADVALAGWVRANTAPDDVFIATPCRRRTRGRVVDARPKLAREPAGRIPQRGVDRLPADQHHESVVLLAAFWMQNAPIRGPIAAFCIQNALRRRRDRFCRVFLGADSLRIAVGGSSTETLVEQ